MMDYFEELMGNIMAHTTRIISAMPEQTLPHSTKIEMLAIIEGSIHDSFKELIYNNLGPMSEEDSIVEYFNPDTKIDIC